MTHFYYYIAAGRDIESGAKFYRVSLGQSKQATRDYLFLVAFSTQHGHFFSLRSADSSEFVGKCLASLGIDFSGVTSISGRDLVRLLKSGEKHLLDERTLHAQHQFLCATNPLYYISSALARGKKRTA